MSIVLVIEDDVDQRRYIAAMLTNSGHDVIEAGDGEEGIQLFKSNPIDLVLTDIFMPRKEGLSTIMELKELSPETKIIAMTAGSRSLADALDIAMELGADIVLKKPLEIESLNDALKEATSKVLSPGR
jgi:CheY-like chemotaxis protein